MRNAAAVTPPHPTEHFECTRLRATLSRAACAKQHGLANLPHPRPGTQTQLSTALQRCRGCDVGAEHARGHAAGPSVELVQLRATHPAHRRHWCLACGRQLVPERWKRRYCSLDCKDAGARLSYVERNAEVEVSL
jgi:hypothetical protein